MITPAARQLIIGAEGLNQPGHWPGRESGITLGWGYDLGAVTAAEFAADWGPELMPVTIARLQRACGLGGYQARDLAPSYSDIRITPAMANAVFDRVSLPKYERQTARAFPGYRLLPPDAQGALISLVYNRGPALEGERRTEMAAIARILADGVQAGDLQAIALQLRAMKRLWLGKNMNGLLARREAEARLVEGCIGREADDVRSRD